MPKDLANQPISESEAASLFGVLSEISPLILAVSGGPDSVALLWLAARWRDALEQPPKLVAVTIDHGLRAESAREAKTVARLAKSLNVSHRTLRWTGRKPKTGIQEAARNARYRLLGEAARKAGAGHVLTAHTLDDQAETVLFRMARGSGIAGLKGMAASAPLPSFRGAAERRARNPYPGVGVMDSGPGPLGRPGMTGLILLRPFLSVPKSRLLATLAAAGIPFADDPSNRDPRFTRPRLRDLMPRLAAEGLDATRLATLARRVARADRAIEQAVDAAMADLCGETGGAMVFASGFAALPTEVALRALGRAVTRTGSEGPPELAKLEALCDALEVACGRNARFRRTLAGAMVTLAKGQLTVERAPARRTGGKTGSAKGRSPRPRRMT